MPLNCHFQSKVLKAVESFLDKICHSIPTYTENYKHNVFISFFFFSGFFFFLNLSTLSSGREKKEGWDCAAPRPRRGARCHQTGQRASCTCRARARSRSGRLGRAACPSWVFLPWFCCKRTWRVHQLSLSQYELFRFPRHFLDTQKAIFKYREKEATRGRTLWDFPKLFVGSARGRALALIFLCAEQRISPEVGHAPHFIFGKS